MNNLKDRLSEARDIKFSIRTRSAEALEKGPHSKRAMTLSLAEVYVQGVSNRKVKTITVQLCGMSVSSAQVSIAATLLDTGAVGFDKLNPSARKGAIMAKE